MAGRAASQTRRQAWRRELDGGRRRRQVGGPAGRQAGRRAGQLLKFWGLSLRRAPARHVLAPKGIHDKRCRRGSILHKLFQAEGKDVANLCRCASAHQSKDIRIGNNRGRGRRGRGRGFPGPGPIQQPGPVNHHSPSTRDPRGEGDTRGRSRRLYDRRRECAVGVRPAASEGSATFSSGTWSVSAA